MSSVAYRTDNYSGLKDNARYIHINPKSKKQATGRKSSGSMPKKPEKPSNLRRLFRWIVLGLSLFLIGELVFHLLIGPRLVLEEVHIVADRALPLTDEDILRLAGVAQKDYYFSLDTEEMEQLLTSYPLIKNAEVERIFPNKLKIALGGREPLGMTLARTGNSTVPLVFDEEGVIFQIGSSVAEYDMPVLSGIGIPSVTLGMELPEELKQLLKDLYELRSSAPQLFEIISELKVERKKDSRFEVLLYPRQYETKIRIGDRVDETMIKYILVVLDVLEQEGGADIRELDFRTGEVVIRMNEG
jgi:cell division protein FtsQ